MENSHSFSARFSEWIVSKPWQALVAGCLILALLMVGLPSLTADFSYRVWFKESNPRLQAFDEFERKFGSDDVAVIGIHSPSGIFDKTSSQLIIDITEDLWQVTEVIRVDSLSNFNWVHGKGDDILVDPFIPNDLEITDELLAQRARVALDHRNIKGYLISEDLKTSLIYLNLKPSLEGKPDYAKVNKELRATIKKYENSSQYGSDHEFYVTGSPALTFGFQESSQNDMAKLVPMVFLITLIFLGLFFRKVSGVLLPLLVIVPSIVATLGFSGWIGIEMNVMTSIVPQFLIALSIAVIVHVLVSFYQFMRKGLRKNDALKLAILKNLTPTILTSVSTAIGFLSFMTSSMPPIAKMGVLAGFGTLFSWVFSFLIVVPLIRLLPLKDNAEEGKSTQDILKPSERSYRLADQVIRFRTAIIALFVCIGIGSAYLASQTRVSSDPFDYFDKSYPLSIANYFVEDNVGGSMGIETVVESGEEEGIKDPDFLQKASRFQNWLDDKAFITKTVSIVDILKEMNQTLNGGEKSQYKLADNRELLSQQLFLYTMNLPQGMDINNRVTIKNDAIRLTAMTTEHDSEKFMKFIDTLENKAKEFGLKAWVTGKGPLYQSNNELVVNSFVLSLSLAVFLVGLLLLFGLKSVKIGLVSLIPNTLPLLIGSGFVYLYGATLDIGTVVVGSVCLGIAVDDTIHFLANYQLFRRSGDSPREAIAKVFTNTVPALVTTTVVLVAAFGCFIFATFVPNQHFGVFVASILTVALITDLLFLPALLLTIDKD
jgi:predicted RND superfamily exporter protein